MTIREFFQNTYNVLVSIYPLPEAKEITYRLFDFYLNLSKIDIAIDGNKDMGKSSTLDESLARLLKHEPLQYILGEADFFDLTFNVNENVLIPRPETEELIQLILQQYNHKSPIILEIGTGSGCIPIALKHSLPQADVSGCDISKLALEVAKSNAIKNSVDVNFFECDILTETHKIKGSYDVIVSNPPYICENERSLMRNNVLDYEPSLALFVPNDNALLFYRAIAILAIDVLNKGGHLYFEINEALGDEMKLMMKEVGFSSIIIHDDIFGKERMLSAVKE